MPEKNLFDDREALIAKLLPQKTSNSNSEKLVEGLAREFVFKSTSIDDLIFGLINAKTKEQDPNKKVVLAYLLVQAEALLRRYS